MINRLHMHVPPALIAAAYDQHVPKWHRHLINPVTLLGVEFLMVRGKVSPHVDREFPQWNYMWVVRCDDPKAVLHQNKEDPLPVATGIVIELDVWRRHWLTQRQSAVFVWLPFDPPQRLELAVAADYMRRLIRA